MIAREVRWAKGNRAAAEMAKRESSFSITYPPCALGGALFKIDIQDGLYIGAAGIALWCGRI